MHTLRINLGSGQRKFGAGWTNVDINPKWDPDVIADGSDMPMFNAGSAEMIVCHHTLEHYGCGEASGMVKEAWRILRPGGSLIVCVPDMNELARMWLEGALSTQVYLTNVYGAFMDSEADRHRWGFDARSLREFLASSAPWTKIVKLDFRTIPGADIARDRWILGMEAVR